MVPARMRAITFQAVVDATVVKCERAQGKFSAFNRPPTYNGKHRAHVMKTQALTAEKGVVLLGDTVGGGTHGMIFFHSQDSIIKLQ